MSYYYYINNKKIVISSVKTSVEQKTCAPYNSRFFIVRSFLYNKCKVSNVRSNSISNASVNPKDLTDLQIETSAIQVN